MGLESVSKNVACIRMNFNPLAPNSLAQADGSKHSALTHLLQNQAVVNVTTLHKGMQSLKMTQTLQAESSTAADATITQPGVSRPRVLGHNERTALEAALKELKKNHNSGKLDQSRDLMLRRGALDVNNAINFCLQVGKILGVDLACSKDGAQTAGNGSQTYISSSEVKDVLCTLLHVIPELCTDADDARKNMQILAIASAHMVFKASITEETASTPDTRHPDVAPTDEAKKLKRDTEELKRKAELNALCQAAVRLVPWMSSDKVEHSFSKEFVHGAKAAFGTTSSRLTMLGGAVATLTGATPLYGLIQAGINTTRHQDKPSNHATRLLTAMIEKAAQSAKGLNVPLSDYTFGLCLGAWVLNHKHDTASTVNKALFTALQNVAGESNQKLILHRWQGQNFDKTLIRHILLEPAAFSHGLAPLRA